MRRSIIVLMAACISVGCNRDNAHQVHVVASNAPQPSAAPTSAPASSATASAPRSPLPTYEGGVLVRAPKDDALYLADEDQGVVLRIALPFDPGKPISTTAVAGLPAQVLALEDRVLVTVRSEGGKPPAAPQDEEKDATPVASAAAPKAPAKKPKQPPIPASPTGPGLLLVMKPDPTAGLVEVSRVVLPQDAWGIAVTPDQRIALVTSAWTHRVSAVEIASGKLLWSISVAREPRAVVVRPDGKSAYVTHLVGAAITRIDGIDAEPRATAIGLPASALRSPIGKNLHATLAYSALLSPDGDRLFVPRHAIGALGEAAWFGTATVDVLLTADDSPAAPLRDGTGPRVRSDPLRGVTKGVAIESKSKVPLVDIVPFSAPRAAAYRKRRDTLLVVGEGSNDLVEMDARSIDPSMFVKQSIPLGRKDSTFSSKPDSCSAPSGLALSADESMAWVFCRASRGMLQVVLDKQRDTMPNDIVRMPLADDLMGRGYNSGRRIFFDAYSVGGGLSCAGCHPEGRDDGHVWHEATFAISAQDRKSTNFLGDADQAPLESTQRIGYPRQTPMLAGRTAAKGPYGWHGQSDDLATQIVRGATLHNWGETAPADINIANALAAFVRHGLVPPPREQRPQTPEEKRGEEIFLSDKTQCATCHVPATEYTDRIAYPLSKQAPLPGFEDEGEAKFKTPSLLFIAGTAPYYHDGRATTLEALIEQNGNRMGRTSHLSPEERAALVAFLRSL